MWLLASVGSIEAPGVITDAVGTLRLSPVFTCAPHRRWASFLRKRPHAGLCAQVCTRAAGSEHQLWERGAAPSERRMRCLPHAPCGACLQQWPLPYNHPVVQKARCRVGLDIIWRPADWETHQVSRKLGLYNERSLEPLQSLRDVRTILNSSALKSTGCPSRGARIGSQHHTTAHNQL